MSLASISIISKFWIVPIEGLLLKAQGASRVERSIY